jgi:hypothetical protein
MGALGVLVAFDFDFGYRQNPMVEDTENLVLELLRRIDRRLQNVENDGQDVKARLGSLEEQIAGLRRDFARLEVRMDRLDGRIERIGISLGDRPVYSVRQPCLLPGW